MHYYMYMQNRVYTDSPPKYGSKTSVVAVPLGKKFVDLTTARNETCTDP